MFAAYYHENTEAIANNFIKATVPHAQIADTNAAAFQIRCLGSGIEVKVLSSNCYQAKI